MCPFFNKKIYPSPPKTKVHFFKLSYTRKQMAIFKYILQANGDAQLGKYAGEEASAAANESLFISKYTY